MLTRNSGYLLAGLLVISAGPAALGGSSNSLMDVSPDGARLLVANPDNGTVTVVDLGRQMALREIRIGDKAEAVSWVGNGPEAIAVSYTEDLLVFFNAEDGKTLARLKTAAEPYGIVANKDGTTAWITHEYPGLVSEIDLKKRSIRGTTPVGAFLRGIALSPDEKRLYVSEFYTTKLHAVELRADGKHQVVDSWSGQGSDNLCRHVAIHPNRPKAYLSHIRSRVTVADSSGSIFPHLTICDLVPPSSAKRRASIALDTYNNVRVVTNPWESALSPNGKHLYTIYAGTNDMNISRVVDDDYQEVERHGYAVNVGNNPRAVRTSPDGATVYIYNAMDFNVTCHNAATMRRTATIKVCDPPKTPEWVRGKVLFNAATPPMSSRQWIACSSCHPDGHNDGRVWQNPEGLRKTTAFFGMAHTHPLHWSADRDEVQDFEYTIRGRLMQGRGLLHDEIKPKRGFEKAELQENLSGRSKDLDALAIYCNSFDFRLSPHITAPGKLSAEAERGKTLFFSKGVDCASCHNGPYYTDSSLQKPFKIHDVGTGKDDPSEKMGSEYDTPTLLGVYRTAPYLHHGKAKTMKEVLTTFNKDDKHGKTSHLKPAEIEDLIAFLQSLPFEQPPSETPNTVKYRITPSGKP